MDTLKIKTFLLIEKYKSFTKTAEKFSYTPSAISHIADSLEDELGVKLFVRKRNGVELTKSGKALSSKFADIINAENNLYVAASALSKQNSSSLRIGTYSSIALHFLPEVLQSFKKDYPTVNTTILVDDYMQDWLENDIADVILADELICTTNNWQPLMTDEYVAVVPSDAFSGKDEISPEEIYMHPFIRPDEAKLDNYLDYSRFDEIIPVKSIENNSIIYMVKENLGMTILPKLSIKSLPDGVRAINLNPKITRTIGIVYDAKHASWACERFSKHIKKYIK